MAGVLQFALGLETSKFVSGADNALARLTSMIGVGKLLTTVFDGVMGAIDRGGALADLSARTGESVGTLYQLEEAFKIVGSSAEAVPGTIRNIQKSLAGVDESGKKTGTLFAAMGLDMEKLKSMDAAKQIETIGIALNKLSKEQATTAATKIGGREGSAALLMAARDAAGYNQSLKDTAGSASVIQRTADAFDRIGDTITTILRDDMRKADVANAAAELWNSLE